MELELPVIETVADGYAALTAAGRGDIPSDSFWYVEKRCRALGIAPEAITAAVRRVKTPEGAEHFNQPIGSIIIDKSYIRGARKLVSDIAVGDTITKPDGKRETRLKIRSVKKGQKYMSGEALDTRTGEVESFKLPLTTANGRAATTQLWDEVESGVKAKIKPAAKDKSLDEMTDDELAKVMNDTRYPGLAKTAREKFNERSRKAAAKKKLFDKVDETTGKKVIFSPSRKHLSEELKKYQSSKAKTPAEQRRADKGDSRAGPSGFVTYQTNIPESSITHADLDKYHEVDHIYPSGERGKIWVTGEEKDPGFGLTPAMMKQLRKKADANADKDRSDITIEESDAANAELGEQSEARQIYNEARAQGASHEDALDAADGFDKTPVGKKSKVKKPSGSRAEMFSNWTDAQLEAVATGGFPSLTADDVKQAQAEIDYRKAKGAGSDGSKERVADMLKRNTKTPAQLKKMEEDAESGNFQTNKGWNGKTDEQLLNDLEYYEVPKKRQAEVLSALKEYLEFNPELDIAAWVEAYMDLDDPSFQTNKGWSGETGVAFDESELPEGWSLQKNDPGFSGHDAIYFSKGDNYFAVVAPGPADPDDDKFQLFFGNENGFFDQPEGRFDSWEDAINSLDEITPFDESELPEGWSLQKNDPGFSGHDAIYFSEGGDYFAIVAPGPNDPDDDKFQLFFGNENGFFDQPEGRFDSWEDAINSLGNFDDADKRIPDALPSGWSLQRDDPGFSGHDAVYVNEGLAIVGPVEETGSNFHVYQANRNGDFGSERAEFDTWAEAETVAKAIEQERIPEGLVIDNEDGSTRLNVDMQDNLRPFVEMFDIDSKGDWMSGIPSDGFDTLRQMIDNEDEADTEGFWAERLERLNRTVDWLESMYDLEIDPIDLIDLAEAHHDMGWAIQSQMKAVLEGEALEEQNGNALDYIAQFFSRNVKRTRGLGEVEDYVNMLLEGLESWDRGLTASTLVARAFSQEERDKLAAEGKAMKDGSFPIETKMDLHNAIQAYGRAKSKKKAKAHITARAIALGAVSMLPESWL